MRSDELLFKGVELDAPWFQIRTSSVVSLG